MAGERLDAWHIREVEKNGTKESFWTRIGVGWVNRDGSINLQLNLLAPDGRIHLRKPKPRQDEATSAEEPVPGPSVSPTEDSPF